ncbi:unnamed protein product [Meloidogyne enterolobii]|uniref:Uncharacterized protein n=1 Tax=Meloidogyne enterolobii TaxID=390850 RepID=A0ACB0ZFI8_MELEN
MYVKVGGLGCNRRSRSKGAFMIQLDLLRRAFLMTQLHKRILLTVVGTMVDTIS